MSVRLTQSESRLDWLDERSGQMSGALRKSRTRESIYSIGRLLTFLILPAAWFLFPNSWLGVILCSAVGVAAFGLAVSVHRAAQYLTLFDAGYLTALKEARQSLEDGPTDVRKDELPLRIDDSCLPNRRGPDRRECCPLSMQETDDIDLFSAGLSLFGVLNRCSTYVGRHRLSHWLTHPVTAPVRLRERQRAVRTLHENKDALHALLGSSAILRDSGEEIGNFVKAVRAATPLSDRVRTAPLRAWSVVGPVCIVLLIHNVNWWLPLAVVFAINLVLMSSFQKEVSRCLRPWTVLDRAVSRLSFVCRQGVAHLPANPQLDRIRACFRAALARPALPRLSRRLSLLTWGTDGLLHTLVINPLTFWNLHAVCLLQQSYLDHRDELLEAVEAIGELEALLSLASFGWSLPEYCYPEVTDEGLALAITEGAHPLLPRDEVVCNGLELDANRRLLIITGSNMSGKSTFLRMVGVNALLAQVGAAVPAKSMRIRPMRLMTDLRIRDDLSRKESYYLAEVRQIHRMLSEESDRVPILGLVDEPFRGTNTEERLAASMGVLDSLLKGDGLFLVATHDAELTRVADGVRAVNCHFAEKLDEREIVFDYRMRDGAAKTRNAIRVLEQEGYPESVLNKARDFLKTQTKPPPRPEPRPRSEPRPSGSGTPPA